MATLFHTSPVAIGEVAASGCFGEFLFFASKPYFMTAASNAVVYAVEVESNSHGQITDGGIIEASQLFYHEDAAKLDALVEEFCDRFGVASDDAEEVISERTTLSEVTGEFDGNNEAKVQRFTARAAKILGFRGVQVTDEQGTAWMLDMTNPENAIKKFEGVAQ